jgi:TonB family protein
MFEKVNASRPERGAGVRPLPVSAAIGAHLLLGVLVFELPHNQHRPDPAEAMTLLLLAQPAPLQLPSAPQVRPHGESGTPAPAHRVRRVPRQPQAEPSPQAERVEQLLLAQSAVPSVLPPSTLPLSAALMRGIGEAGVAHSGGAAASFTEGAAPLVEAELLAEAPRMVNRREMTVLLGRLYPLQLRARGVAGEVIVTFIIGTDGRPDMSSVEVLSTSNPAFVQPALRGMPRMRFRPAALDGMPVRVKVTLPIYWVLQDAA